VEVYRHAEADPALDVAVSHALLERARDGEESFRLWRPLAPALSLGRLDLRSSRVGELVALARDAGVEPVRRLAGGHAATLDSGCLCLGWALPVRRLEEASVRYRLVGELIVAALGELGVAARLGEVPGEWCPGAWSVQGPNGKLAGLAQRVVKGAAWCEALLVLERPAALLRLGRRAHELLGLPWDDRAQGALATLVPGERDLHGALADAFARALEPRWAPLEDRPLPAPVRARAVELRDEHRCP
jgi:lipoate-protein ligase A